MAEKDLFSKKNNQNMQNTGSSDSNQSKKNFKFGIAHSNCFKGNLQVFQNKLQNNLIKDQENRNANQQLLKNQEILEDGRFIEQNDMKFKGKLKHELIKENKEKEVQLPIVKNLEEYKQLETQKNIIEKSENKTSSSSLMSTVVTNSNNILTELFICPKCTKTYRLKHSLTRHIKYECGMDPIFSCNFCDRKFKHNYDLNVHIRNKHLRPFV